jgi:hypothetical protein
MRSWQPKSELGKIVRECFHYLPREQAEELFERIASCLVFESTLAIKVLRHPDSPYRHGGPLVEDRGIVSRRLVTTAGVTFLAADWGGAGSHIALWIYHAFGTTATAENVSDTGPIAELTTNHYTGSVRPTGTHVASTNTLTTVATHTQATAGDTVVEHALMTSATPASGTCWDRSLTGSVVLAIGDGITSTYVGTYSAGG